ncbi:hypothetical protein [Methylibium petroleiphilum]|uniref:Uncharacterized protein n=1 Tax=Methylibium petroleiphilum (strain ATCC BAA-1232 / LMG 22953 / PM1) TaxID=420662 RepID=A2SN49_METPP|nr:hypothetical protein [Methylibium petroleiphilum]ABM96988.1 hypothetical protein Mpe_B0213 [Methylibium petroleiphilum PM1]
MERVVFEQKGDFAASNAAEAWCAERGISVGIMERGMPRGLLYGDFEIAKWHNLNRADRAALDGRMTGDMRHGPVAIEIAPARPASGGAA